MVKEKYVTFRADSKTLQEFSELISLDALQKSEEARLVFNLGIKNRRLQLALEKYRNNKVSLEKAAEIAGLSVYEMIEVLQEKGIKYNLDEQSVREYLQKVIR